MEGLPAEGFYYAPTIVDSVDPSSRLGQEEVFGPVLSVMTFTDEGFSSLPFRSRSGPVASTNTFCRTVLVTGGELSMVTRTSTWLPGPARSATATAMAPRIRGRNSRDRPNRQREGGAFLTRSVVS